MARKYAAKSTAAASLRSRATPRPQRVSNTSWAVYLTWAKGGVYLGEDGIYLGHVEARDETDAREKAIKHYNIRESERFRRNIRRRIMNRLTHDEARRIAADIAKLPTFIEAENYRKANGE